MINKGDLNKRKDAMNDEVMRALKLQLSNALNELAQKDEKLNEIREAIKGHIIYDEINEILNKKIKR